MQVRNVVQKLKDYMEQAKKFQVYLPNPKPQTPNPKP